MAAEKAIELDPNNAEAHAVLGDLYRSFYWDWEKARYEFNKAGELSTEYRGSIRALYITLGNWKEALQAAKLTLDQDPLNPANWRNLGQAYLRVDSLDLAERCINKAIELSPSYDEAKRLLSAIYQNKGQYDSAVIILEQINSDQIITLASFHGIYFLTGELEKADHYLQLLLANDNNPIDHSFSIAGCYARREELDEAYRWLEIAYQRKHPVFSLLKIVSVFDHNDHRFQEYLRRLNLPLD